MIISCHSCATRYDLPEHVNSALAITCEVCGHRWREAETIEAIDITHIENAPLKQIPFVIEHDAPEHEAHRLAQLALEAKSKHVSERNMRRQRQRQWGFFGLFLLAPFAAAALAPETIVAAAPITIKAYEAVGIDVNLRGLELRAIEQQHALIGGKRVLAVKGEIHNIANGSRKVPGLVFALLDNNGETLYTWTLDTGRQSLRAGDATGFITRVESPPELAENLKIRFANAAEMGSVTAPPQLKP